MAPSSANESQGSGRSSEASVGSEQGVPTVAEEEQQHEHHEDYPDQAVTARSVVIPSVTVVAAPAEQNDEHDDYDEERHLLLLRPGSQHQCHRHRIRRL